MQKLRVKDYKHITFYFKFLLLFLKYSYMRYKIIYKKYFYTYTFLLYY